MLQPGDHIERYTVEGPLGSGAMGTVYRVTHRSLGMPMALKVLQGSSADAERLVEEGRLQARLRHPGIVSVADLIEIDGRPALVMELVEGRSLDGWVQAERPDLDQRLGVYRLLVEAVGYAHDKGVVHRDLKPGNVLVAHEDGRPRVTDFGIAALAGDDDPARVAGSPAYMAPEQFRRGARPDVRADLWSLGVVLYELCCDQRPFAGSDLSALQQAMSSGDYRHPSEIRGDLPGGVVAVVEACLRADPAARPASCAALLALLDQDRAPDADPVETWEASTFEADEPPSEQEAGEGAGAALVQRRSEGLVAPSSTEAALTTVRRAVPAALTVASMTGGMQLVRVLTDVSLASALGTAALYFVVSFVFLLVLASGMQLWAMRRAVARPAPVVPGSARDRWRQLPRGFRLFLGTGIPYGGAMGLFTGGLILVKGSTLVQALAFALPAAVIGGAFFGLFMAIFTGMHQVVAHSQSGERAITKMSCEQRFSAVVAGAPEDVYAEAEHLVAGLGIARVLEADPDRRSLAVVTHVSNDGSSVIDVRIEREGELTVAHVASRPTLPTQIVDGGSNRRNVDSIVSGLLERFPVAD